MAALVITDVLSVIETRLATSSAHGLATAVSGAMRDGQLPAGTKLPPIRTVAIQLGLSPTTVSSAWGLLNRSGTIRTDGRRGTVIADTSVSGAIRYRRALQRQTSFDLDLSEGIPDPALLPDLRRALRSLTTAATPGNYLDEPDLPELIEVIKADWPYDAEQMTIVDGAMDGLELIARGLIRFGDRVIVEHPGFPPILDLLESLGAILVGVAMDDEGLRPDELDAALGQRCTAVFLQPRGQNPTGISTSPARAEQIAEILRATDVVVIEDDSAGSVASTEPVSVGQWLPSQTVHVRSFSKSHGPDLRLAAVSGPADLIAEITHRRQLGQGWTSRILQRILLGLLTDNLPIAQVALARQTYAGRRAAVVGALALDDIHVRGTDGINIWVPVADEPAALVRLASHGIGVMPGAPFSVLPGQQGHIRVTVGLLADRHIEVARHLAAAARTGSWGPGR
jgi:DNA-binding transcriptional MocR family regulator